MCYRLENKSYIYLLSLESTPKVINELLSKLGTKNAKAVDVVSLSPGEEDDRLENVLGILLTIPRKCFGSSDDSNEQVDEGIFYAKKNGHLPRGIFSLVNIIGNSLDKIEFEEDSVIYKWIQSVQDLSPVDRCDSLLDNSEIDSITTEVAQNVTDSAEIQHEIIAFIKKGDSVYELNGDTPQPIKMVESSDVDLIESVSKRCMHYLDGEPETKFSVLAIIQEN